MGKVFLVALASTLLCCSASAKTVSTELVSVAQLEQMLASARGEADGALAREISCIRLTERLSPARLAKLESGLPGHQAHDQLLAIAAESSFRDLPDTDKLTDPTPDSAAQAVLLARAVAYVEKTVAGWPSFSAWRATTRFGGTATVLAFGLRDDLSTPTGAAWLRSPAAEKWECPGELSFHAHRLDVIERAKLPLFYRQGRSLHVLGTGGEFECSQTGVSTSADFSEVSPLVPLIASAEHATWSHWEQGVGGVAGVFKYAASVNFGVTATEPGHTMEILGELAIRPADGAILRLTEIRRWKIQAFSREYDIAIEFGPVVLAGATLQLPVRRVAMFLTPMLKPRTWDKTMENTYRKYQLAASPLQEYLNEVRFGSYQPYSPPPGQASTRAAADAP